MPRSRRKPEAARARWAGVAGSVIGGSTRTIGLLGALLLASLLTGCGPDASSAPGTSPSPLASATQSPAGPSTGATNKEGTVRERLATGLRATSPVNAALVADPLTTLTPIAAPWLPGWQLLDVLNPTPPHPRRFAAALSESGEALVLAGKPERFNAVVDSAGVRVDSARVATSVATTFLDTTRTFASYSYRIASVDDIKWRPNLDPAQQGAKTKVEQTYGDEVTAPRVRQAGDDWQVQLWMVDGTQLVRHELTVAANGSTSDKPVTVVRDMPVPASR